MARWAGFLLIALATGIRSKSDPPWPWEEHRASSAEELQELLSTVLAQSGAAEVTVEEPGDAEAQERTLRERIASIRKDWQSASAPACHQQLGRLINSLTLKCEGLQPKADWLLDYYVPALPNKTCAESVNDIFALGNEVVETLRVSRDAVASVDVAGETLRRYQALSFLRSWLVDLTRTHHHALLWAGFWDGDPENRTTQAVLSNFAKAIEHATVHPNTFLGRAIEASENLDACYKDPQTSALAGNMWSIASMSFVLGMRERAQGTVIALVNKQITGERSLSQSVLSTHEIPTVGLAAWGLGFWSPKVLVVDLMGTCDKTSPALQRRLLARLPSWAKSMTNWSPEAFATRSRLRWQCIDCSGACSLDEALAEHVEKLVEAKEEQDRKDQQLRQAVSPHLAAQGATELSGEEVRLADKLELSLVLELDWPSFQKLRDRKNVLYEKQARLRWNAKKIVSGEEHPSQHLWVEQLLRQNADPSSLDRLGRTALMVAAFSGHLKVLEALLKAGAQLEASSKDGTALNVAVEHGHVRAVEVLLKAGAQLEARNKEGSTALICAARDGQLKVVDALLKAGAQPEARDQHGETALTSAARHGELEVVEALLKAKAQLEARDEHGATALTSAAEIGNLETVEALLKAGAQLEAPGKYGTTALMSAAETGSLEVVEVLIKAGARLEARRGDGRTALMLAAQTGQLKVVEALVRAGSQLEADDKRGTTAFIFAAELGKLQVVEALLKAGAQLEASSKDGTALIVAAFSGQLEVVEVLLKAGAQLEARDQYGNTALMLAARQGQLKVVEVLLEARAQLDARNEDGFTALTCAVGEGQLQVVEALLKAGAHAEARGRELARDQGHLQIADILMKNVATQSSPREHKILF